MRSQNDGYRARFDPVDVLSAFDAQFGEALLKRIDNFAECLYEQEVSWADKNELDAFQLRRVWLSLCMEAAIHGASSVSALLRAGCEPCLIITARASSRALSGQRRDWLSKK